MAVHTPNDEVLSALLDAEPVGSDAAHVAACSSCQARLAELRAAAVAVAAPPPHAPAELRSAAVARAVDAFSDDSLPGRAAVVTPLRRRRRTTTGSRRVGPLPAAAALVALVVAAGWMFTLTSGGERRSESASDSFESGAGALRSPAAEGEGAGAAGDEPGGEVGLGAGAPSTEDAPPRVQAAAGSAESVADGGDLGAVDDLAAITRQAEADLAGASKPGSIRPCRTQAQSAGTLLWQANVTYKGRAATAYVVRDGAGKRVTQVWATTDCSLIDHRTA